MPDFNPTPPEFPCLGMAEWGVDSTGPWQALVYKDIRYRFRWMPPGRFWMGSKETEPERWNDEDRHLVTLTEGFWLGETTVTQALWRAVMAENPSEFDEDDKLPVENVDWNMVQDFIQRLIQAADCPGLELPTEAQWEYACRAGTETPFSFGEQVTTDQVNFDGNYPYAGGKKGEYRKKTVPVASLPANPWGLYEMHGNVWEWCRDGWQKQLGTEPVRDPLTPAERGADRVVRGGSWNDFGGSVRSACRSHFTPGFRFDYLGFRLARGHIEPGAGGAGG
jgi:formylglycine-generating enzyme